VNEEIRPTAVCEQQHQRTPVAASCFVSPEPSALPVFWVQRLLGLFILLPALLISILLTRL